MWFSLLRNIDSVPTNAGSFTTRIILKYLLQNVTAQQTHIHLVSYNTNLGP